MKKNENLRRWWKEIMTYYPARTDEQRQAHVRVNQIIEQAGEELLDICPRSEQLELVLQHLQIARMWANAGLGIHINNPRKDMVFETPPFETPPPPDDE